MMTGKWVAVTTFVTACGCVGAAQGQPGGAPVQLEEIVVQATPVPSQTGIALDKVPATVSIVPARDFQERRSPSVADAITSHVPGAIALNVDGSDLSPDLFYRGFDASRIPGNKQGLAVYQNGVRINEVFGDTVNLDLIPPIVIDHVDIYTNNPIFGLNALGGAVSFTMKNGFTFHGGDATILGGSYGRVNGFFEYGKQVGNYSFYVAADGYRDGGYRPFGAQNAQRAYADLGYRSQDSEVHAIGSFGRSLLGVQGVTPQVLVNQQYNSVFTTPQTTENQAGLAQLTGRFDVAPHWTLNSNVYFRQFDQSHIDGNDANLDDCANVAPNAVRYAGFTCAQSGGSSTNATRNVLRNANGQLIPYLGDTFPYGTTAHTSTEARSYGAQLQATNNERFYGRDNYFVVGGSFDGGIANFDSYTTIGQLNPLFQNITSGIALPGIGQIAQTQGRIGYSSVSVQSRNAYYGLFALDTFNVTKELAVTAGARFNVADIWLNDRSGLDPSLNTANQYQRLNPVVGATYTVLPALTLYGGYSEANRAPVPLESACSDPLRPCTLESALVADPPLKQVVSHTIEGGGRGQLPVPTLGGQLTYKAGYFRTALNNDIISVPSVFSGQGYYVNVPETVRQGVEAGANYEHGVWSFYGNYAYVDATYQFSGALSSPNNPSANTAGNVFVHPGNHIPGIPRHLGKVGFDYKVTPRFRIGMDTILVGSQYYIGDNANQQPQLPFYYRIDARASYQVTETVQVFGLVNNLTNNHYATFGTFYSTSTGGGLVNNTLAANARSASPNAQAVTVAQPISFYGGVKVTF